MRTISIDSAMSAKIKTGKRSFYQKEVPATFPSLTPGEWFILKSEIDSWLAYGNPFAKDTPSLWVLGRESVEPVAFIRKKIQHALKLRAGCYKNEGQRIVYGQSDKLPGLIIDTYKDHSFIQINTAGMDRYRNDIKNLVDEIYPKKKNYFLDRKKYREAESLPEFAQEWKEDELVTIVDSGITYQLPIGKMQKVGFYFDHRDNRKKFESYLVNEEVVKTRALDLFSYLGSWGLQAARAGSIRVDFVDQANFEDYIIENSKIISPKLDARFHHKDVFKFLDESINEGLLWNVIICDPPAFCKSVKQKQQAISGYKKLYSRIFRLMSEASTLVAASCTKYISLDELTSIVESEARQAGKSLVLRDIGMQSKDHPITSLKDNANYIKYALYSVE
ncbi:MAG: hypothetical protein CME71_05735 [Halobacteriovorax sp.]|nr:hypothetical protein [Halobacteriovorax sp.]